MNCSLTCNLLLSEKTRLTIENNTLQEMVRQLQKQLEIVQSKNLRLQIEETENQKIRADNIRLIEQIHQTEFQYQVQLSQEIAKLKENQLKVDENYILQIDNLKKERDQLLQILNKNQNYRLNTPDALTPSNNLEIQANKLLEIGIRLEQNIARKPTQTLPELQSIQENEIFNKSDFPSQKLASIQQKTLSANTFEDQFLNTLKYKSFKIHSSKNQKLPQFRATYMSNFQKNADKSKQFLQRQIRINKSNDVQSMPHLPHPHVISLKQAQL